MYNSVYCGNRLEGFRCNICGGIFDKMWGETCNGCREKRSENKKLREEIQSLKKIIQLSNI